MEHSKYKDLIPQSVQFLKISDLLTARKEKPPWIFFPSYTLWFSILNDLNVSHDRALPQMSDDPWLSTNI